MENPNYYIEDQKELLLYDEGTLLSNLSYAETTDALVAEFENLLVDCQETLDEYLERTLA